MGNTILPSGQEVSVTPESILKYLDPNGLRQLLRQERLRWNLKANKDCEYSSNQTMFKYGGDLHNNAVYQRMELRTFPDNGAMEGFAGIHCDSGEYGIIHDLEKWDHGISEESLSKLVNRTQFGAMAKVPDKKGYGLDDNGRISTETINRQAALLADPYDGRIYYYSSDDPFYTNNDTRVKRLPLRTLARLGDIPTKISDLINDGHIIADAYYTHTDNNFTDSNRFLLDNLDDRTFVYPEISRDTHGNLIENLHIGLDGSTSYAEGDGTNAYNIQPDPYNDRNGAAVNSYNKNKVYSSVEWPNGYFPGVFRSLEELEKVDLVDQRRSLKTHRDTPGSKRSDNWYIFDGQYTPNVINRMIYSESYLAQPLNPVNMEIALPNREPIPYGALEQTGEAFKRTDLYRWRYNRVNLRYIPKNIEIKIAEQGTGYSVGDRLSYSIGTEIIQYKVTKVGHNGVIQEGELVLSSIKAKYLYQNPSTYGVAVPFTIIHSTGKNAKFIIDCPVSIDVMATQIKNNLYAYVNVVPSVRSDNLSPWSDNKEADTQEGLINLRSTAPSPSYSGVNSGRGGPAPDPNTSLSRFHEHGGNATAGVRVHLFRYVINTKNLSWVVRDGVQVFLGRWVDQGPIGGGLRPCDVKALLFSNFDTNNFNSYYKFNLDLILDGMNRIPDAVTSNNPTAISNLYVHKAQRDPKPDERFTTQRVNCDTSKIENVDITDCVLYINQATGVAFTYNSSYKSDPNYGFGHREMGWIPISGAVAP